MNKEAKFVLTVSAVDGDPLKLGKYRVTGETESTVTIGEGEKARTIQKSAFYKCRNILVDTMIGTDEGKLKAAWDSAITQAMEKAKKRFSSMAFTPIPTESSPNAALSDSIPRVGKEIAQPELSSPSQIGEAIPPSSIPSNTATAKSVSNANIYARAISIEWDKLESLLALWAVKWFRDNSLITIEAHQEQYSDNPDGWYIYLCNLRKEDRPVISEILRKHDPEQEIKLSKEWESEESNGPLSLSFSCAVSNHIVAEEIFPSLDPPFTFGVNRAIASPADIIFISDCQK